MTSAKGRSGLSELRSAAVQSRNEALAKDDSGSWKEMVSFQSAEGRMISRPKKGNGWRP